MNSHIFFISACPFFIASSITSSGTSFAPASIIATLSTVPATVKISGVTYKVTAISKNAFKGCKKLQKVIVGKNVTSIGTAAFASDKSLVSVVVKSKNLKTIGSKAFYKCKNLKKITLKTTSLKKVGKSTLKGISKKATINVSKKYVKKYKKLFSGKGQKNTVKIK